MITIGVTGIMGSGKTLVAGMFESLGASVVDADVIARDLLQPGTGVYDEVTKAFGREILDDGGSVDRKKLAEKVFLESPGRVDALNRILHPEVLRIIEGRIFSLRKSGARAAVIDAPLLVETGLYEKVDFTVVVRLSHSEAAARLCRAGRASPEDFRARTAAQLPAAEKEKHADFIVDNSGRREETFERVREIWESITGGSIKT